MASIKILKEKGILFRIKMIIYLLNSQQIIQKVLLNLQQKNKLIMLNHN